MQPEMVTYLNTLYTHRKIVAVTIDIEHGIVEVVTDKGVTHYTQSKEILRKEERYG